MRDGGRKVARPVDGNGARDFVNEPLHRLADQIGALDVAEPGAAGGEPVAFCLPPGDPVQTLVRRRRESRSEEHTSELQSLMRISYAVFCLKKKKTKTSNTKNI